METHFGRKVRWPSLENHTDGLLLDVTRTIPAVIFRVHSSSIADGAKTPLIFRRQRDAVTAERVTRGAGRPSIRLGRIKALMPVSEQSGWHRGTDIGAPDRPSERKDLQIMDTVSAFSLENIKEVCRIEIRPGGPDTSGVRPCPT